MSPTLLSQTMSPSPIILLGPPELHRHDQIYSPPSDTFMDSHESNFDKNSSTKKKNKNKKKKKKKKKKKNIKKMMGFTENFSSPLLWSGNPCLDFFFHVIPDTPAESLEDRLAQAWAHDPLTALKLVCNLRGVRGNGKSDNEGFYASALWLHRHHPKTLAFNVASFAEFGYFKDLPEILYRLINGPEVRARQRDDWDDKKLCHKIRVYCDSMRPKKAKKTVGKSVPREARVKINLRKGQEEKERAREARRRKFSAMAKKALDRYESDKKFRFLHDKISEYFAECLVKDLQELKACPETPRLSLAAKWCPSLGSSFDRSTLLCESIAKRVFPREEQQHGYEEEAHYAYRVRDRLRKEVLVPLRKALHLPEVYMSANQWSSIPYDRVASVAMKRYKHIFKKHDKKGFAKYLSKVKKGKSKIVAGGLLPHEIVHAVRRGNDYDSDDDGDQVAELKWMRMVEDLAKEGKLRNCLAVCDVSGSMAGDPIDVSVALGILVSELGEDPWKGKVITFSENPKLHLIDGHDLRSKIRFMEILNSGTKIDFQKVFDLILEVAVKGKLKEEEMIKRVFVFSDMEFSQALAGNRWETDYEAALSKFTEKGYGKFVPRIVFWNLRDSKATPIIGDYGVTLLCGYSKHLLKLFLDEDGNAKIRPVTTMHRALSGGEYEKLIVFD